MRAVRAICLGAAMAAMAGGARAVEDYDNCIALVAADPARAEAEAATWANFGGGPAARHCRAMAFAALGATRRAAEELTEIAFVARDLPEETRAEILLQAAGFFLDLQEPDAGLRVTEQAMRLKTTGETLTMRARLRAAKGQYGAALGDLDAAIAQAGPTADRLMLRATARREEGRLLEARQDVIWALELEPDLPIAYLELGRIEQAQSAKDRARDAYMRAIELDPGGDIAASARLSLQRMELGD
ncbi:hypothetical protein H0I76_15330 [Limibaculum sp. M0105]|uniref:Tetratricopeptide repeat protein n=1 Tax=Thermohalobaculum xanthum TaxID=2753746 RepID=A0A8J7M987_9RHOB|nr:hypothetical protein [Thermohalobaculum xanthum]MBK0400570.1 hypothetical protein [Thermohalobaculum xanthum]